MQKIDSPQQQEPENQAASPRSHWWARGIARCISAATGLRYPPSFRLLAVCRQVFGLYDKDVVKVVRRIVTPGSCALDIGANVGYYSRLLSRLGGSEGRVFAFEPTPHTMTYLRRNTQRCANLKCIGTAVGDYNGTADFFIHPSSCSSNSLYELTPTNTTASVPMVTIDTFVQDNNIANIGFVKIDVEGAELRVIQGMRETMKAQRSMYILIEFCPDNLRAAGISPDQFMSDLSDAELTAYRVCPSGIVAPLNDDIPNVASMPKRMINLLCRQDPLPDILMKRTQ